MKLGHLSGGARRQLRYQVKAPQLPLSCQSSHPVSSVVVPEVAVLPFRRNATFLTPNSVPRILSTGAQGAPRPRTGPSPPGSPRIQNTVHTNLLLARLERTPGISKGGSLCLTATFRSAPISIN